MPTRTSGWPMLLCFSCLVLAAVTVCLQPRARGPVTLSITSGEIPDIDSQPRPIAIVRGEANSVEVFEDGQQRTFRVTSQSGEATERMSLSELKYQYPELEKLLGRSSTP